MKILETEVVVQTKDSNNSQLNRLAELGIIPDEEDDGYKDHIIRFIFKYEDILQVRETLVDYKGSWLKGCVCVYKYEDSIIETPPILSDYDEISKIMRDEQEKRIENSAESSKIE